MKAKRAAIVLCGGLSSRMGRAKALLPWFGRRLMIQHVVETLRPVVDEVIVVRSADLVLPPLPDDVKVVVDGESARGPLAGIRDGLAATDAASAFVTSTDAPFLTAPYVNRLFEFAGDGACAPVEDGFVQVLSAIYPGTANVEAQALLDADQGRPRALLEALSYRPIKPEQCGEGRKAWEGFNTPAAYLDIVRGMEPEASATLILEGVSPVASALVSAGRSARVPVGTLGDVLSEGMKALGEGGRLWRAGEQVADEFRVRLGGAVGQGDVRTLAIPVGPDETVTISAAVPVATKASCVDDAGSAERRVG